MRYVRIALLLTTYFALVLLMPLSDRLVLFPSTAPIETHGATRQLIPFENGQLEVWTSKSQTAQRIGRVEIYVLRFYGNADRADRWVAAEAEAWDGRAVEIWGMNYPGFGGSTGPARLKRIAPAALAAFDALKQEAGEQRVILFGASLGATAALHVAAHRSVAGLILHNPPPLREVILRQFGWWNLWLLAGPVALQIPAELDSVSNSKNVHAPAVFLLADQDEIVAPRFQKLVVEAYAGEKRVIALRGAHHNSPIEGAAVTDLHNALDWLLPRSEAR
jgi:pimeloyl-ACP methyl ester carboxylesterase